MFIFSLPICKGFIGKDLYMFIAFSVSCAVSPLPTDAGCVLEFHPHLSSSFMSSRRGQNVLEASAST